MAKQSKRNRRRMHQGGFGGGFQIVHRTPRTARRLPTAPELDTGTELRLRCVEHSYQEGVAAATRVFGRSRATVYRWRQRYDPTDLRSLLPHSRRPKRTRRQQWTAEQEAAILRLRHQFPRAGKAKLVHLLRAQGLLLPESTSGRMLASLRRRHLLIAPHVVRERKRHQARPSATRGPTDKRQPAQPGQVIQLDTMHLHPLPGVEWRQCTAIDVVSRCAVLGVRSQATSGTATAFLDELLTRFPFPVEAIQVDGGSEFMADFEAACQAKAIALYFLPPPLSQAQWPGRTPQWHAAKGVLGVRRRRPGPADAAAGTARLRDRLQ